MEEKRFFRLEEMADSMDATIDNIAEVRNQQHELIDIIKESDKAEDFSQFIDETEKQIEKMEEQQESIAVQMSYLKDVIKSCKESEEKMELIEKFMKAIRMFEN